MKRILVVLSVVLLLACAASLAVSAAHTSGDNASDVRGLHTTAEPIVRQAVKSDLSQPLHSMPAMPLTTPGERQLREMPLLKLSKVQSPKSKIQNPASEIRNPKSKIQNRLVIPTPIASFDGAYNYWGFYPPDTNGDVGPNHYVQTVNVGFQIFSKTGATLYGPADTNVLWQGFGGQCEIENAGDPIALYDPLANRWLISQFTIVGPPYYQCIAISTSGDPTGSYYRYAFVSNPSLFEDYPHFGVWPDGYYMTTNEFFSADSPEGFAGAGNFVFERDRMLIGDPNARMVYFHLSPPDGGILPSDMDGPAPPAGSPNYFLEFFDNGANDQLGVFEFHVDWTTPGNSTFTGPTLINTDPFDSNVANAPQPGTSQRLDSLSDRLMYKVAYRNFGTHESLVLNHTVLGGSNQAGIRWYELRSPGSSPTIFQQGTFAPDAEYRWMGSIAMDQMGNIGLGYSISSGTRYPSVRYTGRLATDPPGTLPQGEGTFVDGTGSQTGTAQRWGDYSSMSVDPTDDCTFWFTTEYYQNTGERNWRTRVGAFKFPNCVPGASTPTSTIPPTRTPTATPTLCPGGVTITGVITNTDTVQTGRLNRGSPPSNCTLPRGCPGGVTDSFQRHYDSYTYTNSSGSPVCVTVRIASNCGDNAILSAAYLNTYNPSSPCTNYLGDMGISGPQYSYSFNVPADGTYVIVILENAAGVGCDSYTLNVSPCGGGTPLPTNTRTPTALPTGTEPVITSTRTPTMPSTGTPTFTHEPTRKPTWNTSTPPAATDTPVNTATPTPCDITFSDVNPSDYFYEPVMYLACHGVVTGYADDTFRPYNNTTRGQLSKIVVLAEGWQVECPTKPTFTDVLPDSPFFCFVETAYDMGVITGYSDGTFRPGNNVTRGQLSKIIVLAEQWQIDTTGGPHFSDVPENSTFYDFIETAFNHEIISGYADGTFLPGNNATRGQICKIVYLAITQP